jgi:hypothetical protein
VARLTYAALALALGALISGFFVRTTAVPLFASIGLSALVLILILRGWARRIRQAPLGEEIEEVEELEDVDAGDFVIIEAGEESGELPVVSARRAGIGSRRRERVVEGDKEPDRERVPRPRPAGPPRARVPGAGGSRRVVVLPGRSRYHMPGCRFAEGKGAEEIAESTARRRRYRPCSACMR